MTTASLSSGAAACCSTSPLATRSGGDAVTKGVGTSPCLFGCLADVEFLLRSSECLLALLSSHSEQIAGVKARTVSGFSANAQPREGKVLMVMSSQRVTYNLVDRSLKDFVL